MEGQLLHFKEKFVIEVNVCFFLDFVVKEFDLFLEGGHWELINGWVRLGYYF